MDTTGPPHNLPYPGDDDPVSSWPQTLSALAQAIADRLGEAGNTTITPSGVNVTTSKRINYSRTYPGIPKAYLQIREAVGASNIVNVWPSGEDESGFTLNIRADTTAARDIGWRVLL